MTAHRRSPQPRRHGQQVRQRHQRQGRQRIILDLIEREPFHSQDALRRRLEQRGVFATQATISRDIKELGLVKRPGDRAYQRQDASAPASVGAIAALERALGELVQSIARARQLVVVRTGAGQAQPLALAIDRAGLPEAVGTVAGDDTILIVARDDRRAAALVRRFERYTVGTVTPARSRGRA